MRTVKVKGKTAIKETRKSKRDSIKNKKIYNDVKILNSKLIVADVNGIEIAEFNRVMDKFEDEFDKKFMFLHYVEYCSMNRCHVFYCEKLSENFYMLVDTTNAVRFATYRDLKENYRYADITINDEMEKITLLKKYILKEEK